MTNEDDSKKTALYMSAQVKSVEHHCEKMTQALSLVEVSVKRQVYLNRFKAQTMKFVLGKFGEMRDSLYRTEIIVDYLKGISGERKTNRDAAEIPPAKPPSNRDIEEKLENLPGDD